MQFNKLGICCSWFSFSSSCSFSKKVQLIRPIHFRSSYIDVFSRKSSFLHPRRIKFSICPPLQNYNGSRNSDIQIASLQHGVARCPNVVFSGESLWILSQWVLQLHLELFEFAEQVPRGSSLLMGWALPVLVGLFLIVFQYQLSLPLNQLLPSLCSAKFLLPKTRFIIFSISSS